MAASREDAGPAPRPRSRPKRRSGREIVQAVLQAASLLLQRDGLEGMTTNAVARVAGVSIGSVYQYFPDKHALVAELARSLEQQGLELAVARLEGALDGSARDAAWSMVGVLLDPALGDPQLRRGLLLEVPRGWIDGATRRTDGVVEQLLASYMATRDDIRAAVSHERGAFVVLHAVEGAVEGALLTDPDLLRHPPFHRELFRLAWCYAAADGQDSSPPREVEPARAGGPERDERSSPFRLRLDAEPSRRPDSTTRRSASSRGKDTADAIVEAAGRVLAGQGYSGLGMRRIAREAGLSPGALYRHFPNKQAVVAELTQRVHLRGRDAFLKTIEDTPRRSLRGGCEDLVRLYASPELGEPGLRRALLSQAPRRWTADATAATDRLAVDRVTAALAARGDEVREGDHELMAFVLCRAIKAVVDSALLREPRWIESGALVGDLTELAWRYLRYRARS